jgi:uncharacterized repeat protein (TIGR03803 family)
MRTARPQANRSLIVAAVLMIGLMSAARFAQAQTFSVLYTFTGGADGGMPDAGVVQDSAGNLYGTTSAGGSGTFNCVTGCGTVFKVDTAGNETVLYDFAGNKDGATPLYGGLFRDSSGNLYGTTSVGGAAGNGTIFKVNPTSKERAVSFAGGKSGGFPAAGLVPDGAGNAYGTTQYRGTGCPPYGCGTVFKVNSAGKVTVLYSFLGGSDGANPVSGLVRDSVGSFYGTTLNGGASNAGTVFKIDPTGKETVLHAFTGGTDGAKPYAGLVLDDAGDLYGVTSAGGANNGGTVFQVDSTGKETVLYNFCCADGQSPMGTLTRDSTGNLYGTTFAGGPAFGGTVFKLDSTGTETVLYSFCAQNNCADGVQPYAGVLRDSAGSLYGTTSGGGVNGAGVVFKIAP